MAKLRCLREFPAISHVGLLGGLERTVSAVAFRLLVGPAVFAGDGASGLGGQCQLDAAVGVTHVAFVLAARCSVIARVNGERLQLATLGLGFRLR